MQLSARAFWLATVAAGGRRILGRSAGSFALGLIAFIGMVTAGVFFIHRGIAG